MDCLGDCYTFTANRRRSPSLMPCWLVGFRDARACAEELHARPCARASLRASASSSRPMRCAPYPRRRRKARLRGDVDYAVLNKTYDRRHGPVVEAKRRYSPAVVHRLHQDGALSMAIAGNGPSISTSLRRAREPDDAHGDAPVHAADQCVLQEDRERTRMRSAFYFLHYNFARVHKAHACHARDGRRGRRSRLRWRFLSTASNVASRLPAKRLRAANDRKQDSTNGSSNVSPANTSC